MVRVETRDDVGTGVLLVTLDRPERRNAIDHATLLELLELQASWTGGHRPRVVVVTGSPPAFSAGADLHGVEESVFTADLLRVLRGFTALAAPVVAAIDGPALGGGAQVAAVCDLRVATADSVIGVPAAKLGLVVDHWTVERLTREFSWPVARAMLVGAQTYTADDLHRLGAIHRLGGLDVALDWAADLARLAPLTIAGHKIALEASAGDPVPDAEVAAARSVAWSSNDAAEGRQAFLDKRRPEFRGT